MLDGLFRLLHRLNGLITGSTDKLPFQRFRRPLFFELPDAVLCLGYIPLGFRQPLASLLIELMRRFVGHAVYAALDAVGGIFLCAVFFGMGGVFRLLLGLHIGGAHPVGGNRRLVYFLDGAFHYISCFDFRHFLSFPGRTKTPLN